MIEPIRPTRETAKREAQAGPGFDLRGRSDSFDVRQALAAVLEALEPLSLDPEEVFAVELVLAEVLNNVLEHAFPEGDTPGAIRLRGHHDATGLHVMVEDTGRAMPDSKLPVGEAASVDVPVPDLPEGGFGWFLIRDIARDVRYDRREGLNRLRLRISLAPPRLS